MSKRKPKKSRTKASRLSIALGYCKETAGQVKTAALKTLSAKAVELVNLGLTVYILLSINALHIKLNIFYQDVGNAFQEMGMALGIIFMTFSEALQELLQRGQGA